MRITVDGLRGRHEVVECRPGEVLLRPNGGGKTTVLDAVVLALTGRTLDGREVTRERMQALGGRWSVAFEDHVFGQWRRVERTCDGARVHVSYSGTGRQATSAEHSAALVRDLRPIVITVGCAEVARLDGARLQEVAARWATGAAKAEPIPAMVAERAKVPEAAVLDVCGPVGGADAASWLSAARQRIADALREARARKRGLAAPRDVPDIAPLEAEVARLSAALRAVEDGPTEAERALGRAEAALEAARMGLDHATRQSRSVAEAAPTPPSEPRPDRAPDIAAFEAALAEARSALMAAERHASTIIRLGDVCPTCGQAIAPDARARCDAAVAAADRAVGEARARLDILLAAEAGVRRRHAAWTAWQRWQDAHAEYERRVADAERNLARAREVVAEAEAAMAVARARAEAEQAETEARRQQRAAHLDALRRATEALAEAQALRAEADRRASLESRCATLERLSEALDAVEAESCTDAYSSLVATLSPLLAPLGDAVPVVHGGRLYVQRGDTLIAPDELSAGERVVYALAVGGAVAATHLAAGRLAVMLIDNLEVVDENHARAVEAAIRWCADHAVPVVCASSRPIFGPAHNDTSDAAPPRTRRRRPMPPGEFARDLSGLAEECQVSSAVADAAVREVLGQDATPERIEATTPEERDAIRSALRRRAAEAQGRLI